MKVQINFWNNKAPLEYKVRTIKEAIVLAIKEDANLRNADLSDADLRYANLRNANLRYADLSDANLRNANLRYADLSDANLRNANLRYADLSDANLRNADLRYADLRNANLRNADLSDADLRYANLRNADLRYADLRNAILTLITGIHQRYSVLIINDNIKIGCEFHSIEEWEKFTEKEILIMDGKEALKWWKQYKPIIIPLAKLRYKELKRIGRNENFHIL